MNPGLQTLLEKCASTGDAVAWSIWHGSARMETEANQNWFTHEQIENALRSLVGTANSLHQHRIQPVRLCWTFDRVRVHLAIRPDDVCLGIFVKNLGAENPAAVVNALEEFLALPEV